MGRHALPTWEWPVAGALHLGAFLLVALAQCGSKPVKLFEPPDAIIVEMAGPTTLASRMPQRAERAPTPAQGTPDPTAAPPPPNPSELALPDTPPTRGQQDPTRDALVDELRKQQLLAALDAPEGQVDRLESGSASAGSGSKAQAGVSDPELAAWVARANEALKKNFHPLPAWCGSRPDLVARAAATVRADGTITEEATIVDSSRNPSFDAACVRAFANTARLPPLPARFAPSIRGVLECPCA
jgi:hypothetical protein